MDAQTEVELKIPQLTLENLHSSIGIELEILQS